jgi:hypothetical protein
MCNTCKWIALNNSQSIYLQVLHMLLTVTSTNRSTYRCYTCYWLLHQSIDPLTGVTHVIDWTKMYRIGSKNSLAMSYKRLLLICYCSQDFISGSITFLKHESLIYVLSQGRVMYVIVRRHYRQILFHGIHGHTISVHNLLQ